MEKLAFVIWVIAWPFSNALGNYFYALQRKITGKDPSDDFTKALSALSTVFIWVWIAKHLWPF